MKIPGRALLSRWLPSGKAPVAVQLLKYGMCGLASTIILLVIVIGLSLTFIPALDGSLIDGQQISDAQRQHNLIINNLIAFPFSNLVNYLLNVRIVFVPGRHSRTVEFAIFTAISAVSFLAGLLGGPFLVGRFGLPSLLAQFMLVTTSALVNFLCRKFLVFSR